jgi:hypothetical protein
MEDRYKGSNKSRIEMKEKRNESYDEKSNITAVYSREEVLRRAFAAKERIAGYDLQHSRSRKHSGEE